MARHLPTAGVRIDRGAHGAIEHFGGRYAKLQAEGPVAIIQVEPVVRRTQHQAGRRQHRFMAGTRDLKEDLVLALELNLLVVQAARRVHHAVGVHHLLTRERGLGGSSLTGAARAGRSGHRNDLKGWRRTTPKLTAGRERMRHFAAGFMRRLLDVGFGGRLARGSLISGTTVCMHLLLLGRRPAAIASSAI